MILLVTAMERGRECTVALEQATGEPVVLAENLSRATTLLRADCYEAAVFDQQLSEAEPLEAQTAIDHLGTAMPLQVNLAICGMERMVCEVQCALQRRKREQAAAREAAARSLQGALSGTLTSLLLHCEMVLQASGIPKEAAEKIISIHEAAQDLRKELEASGTTALVQPGPG